MKIIIKADGHNIRLWFPLSIVKSRIGYNVAKNALERNAKKQIEQVEQEKNTETSLTREQMVEMYNILKRCVKENGHFNIIEVNSHDGEKVLIRV